MRRFLKVILFFLLLLVLAAIALNLFRLTARTPEPVLSSVTRGGNVMADLYAARSGSRVLLFDGGNDPMGRGLDALLASLSSTRQDVTDVFVTHGHFDHTAALELVPHAKVHAGAADVAMIDGSAPMMPTGARMASLVTPGGHGKVNDPLTQAANITVGIGESVRAIPFPGHTPGSFIYLWQKVLFVGDSMNYSKGQLEPSVPAFSVDEAENHRSLAGLRKALAGAAVEVVCTGHQGCTPPAETQKLLEDLIKRMQ